MGCGKFVLQLVVDVIAGFMVGLLGWLGWVLWQDGHQYFAFVQWALVVRFASSVPNIDK